MRQQLTRARRWVVKIGSALLTDDGRGLNHAGINQWVAQMAALKRRGIEVVLVSSGAVAAGMTRLGWKQRPVAVHDLQAAAAVGQMGLIQTYESQFQRYGLHTAQILLGHDDISSRERYLNARGALTTLIGLGVVPVINENDTVVTDEIRFGDNDTLAGLAANLVEADVLVILTDKDGLYDSDPATNAQATLIDHAGVDDAVLDRVAGDSISGLGRGGMITKVRAARLAARSGADTVIAGGRIDAVLTQLADGQPVGTLLEARQPPWAARKQWLAGMLRKAGSLTLDDGAVRVLRESGRSLLPVGVKKVDGLFRRGELVACLDGQGREIARGLVNYNADEALRIIGHGSDQLAAILGYQGEPELIHRDNLVVTADRENR